MKLNWQYESSECNLTKIAITGERTMLRLSFNESIKSWKCEALYKRTPKCRTISSVAVWSVSNETQAIEGCVSNVIERAKGMGYRDKSNEFDFVSQYV